MNFAGKFCFFLAVLALGCSGDGMPAYDGSNAKEYWYANCRAKPMEIQDKEVCRKSHTQMKIDRNKNMNRM